MKIPVHNPGAAPIYVMGQMVPAGETRHFEEHEVPPELRPGAPEPEPEPPVDPIAEILKGPVKGILAGVEGLDGDTLKALLAAEEAAQAPRKTLVEGLSAEILRRNVAALDAGAGEDGADPLAPGDDAGAGGA